MRLLALATAILLAGCVAPDLTPAAESAAEGPFRGVSWGYSSGRSVDGHVVIDVDGRFRVEGTSPVLVTLILDDDEGGCSVDAYWTEAPYATSIEKSIEPVDGEAPFEYHLEMDEGVRGGSLTHWYLGEAPLAVWILAQSEGHAFAPGCSSL